MSPVTGVRAESRDNHAGIQENVRKENSDNIEMIRDFILPVIIIPFFWKRHYPVCCLNAILS